MSKIVKKIIEKASDCPFQCTGNLLKTKTNKNIVPVYIWSVIGKKCSWWTMAENGRAVWYQHLVMGHASDCCWWHLNSVQFTLQISKNIVAYSMKRTVTNVVSALWINGVHWMTTERRIDRFSYMYGAFKRTNGVQSFSQKVIDNKSHATNLEQNENINKTVIPCAL